MDDGCLEIFLAELSKATPEHHLLIVLDGAPSHRSEQITHPENISLLMLPPYSPELDLAERWFRSSGESSQTGRLRRSHYCNRRSPRRLHPTGKSLPSSNGSQGSLGGQRPWRRHDINSRNGIITDERGLAPKGPKAFIAYKTKRLLSFLRVQIDFPFTNGAAQIRLLAKVREMGILAG